MNLGICYGRNALYLARKGYNVTGVDISQIAIDQCRQKANKNGLDLHYICQDLGDFAIKDKYDVIYSTATLHYLGNRSKINRIIREMKKHTLAGGLNIISVPTDTKIAMDFPYYFKGEELRSYYKDWTILEYSEEDDHFSNGRVGTIAFVIAKQKNKAD